MDSHLISRLEPELAAVFDSFPAMDLTDLQGAREALRARPARRPDREAVARVDRQIPGAPGDPDVLLRFYRPRGADPDLALPCLIWIHGGGYVMGSIDLNDGFLETLVSELGCAAVSVEWRQAPEHPFPAAHDDCYAATRWLFTHAAETGIDPARIVLGGGSCGGGLAAGVALRLRDEGEPQPCLQMLLYPMIDDRADSPSWLATTDPRLWNREGNLLGWRAYLGSLAGGDAVPEYAAPARATDLRGLAPAFVAVGDVDGFLDENIDYAQRLLRAGVPTELHVYPGMIHGFNSGAFDTPRTRQYLRDRNTALGIAFGL